EPVLLQAVRLDPKMTSAHLELAQVYDREKKHAGALTEINAAAKLDPTSYRIHFVRAQVLQHMGRAQEAKAELRTYTSLFAEARERGRLALEQGALPNPELSRDPQ
ncbi:MAG: hypothetical protein WAL76_13305, partial [Candidatus Sulfotelmatobacter sp.]